MSSDPAGDLVLSLFRPATRAWFEASFPHPTPPQVQGWPAIARGESTLILSPTGSGKTLTAFMHAIDRLLFEPRPATKERCRVLYVSPIKALAADVERNLKVPLAGIADVAASRGDAFHLPAIAVRTGDTPAKERARFKREPADLLITTPESLYLLLTSQAREVLRHVDTVILDEIHALVPTKRGAHLALTLERLEQLVGKPLQRIGLSATQRPLEEVARFLGGAEPQIAPPPVAGTDGLQEASSEFVDPSEHEPAYRPVTRIDARAPKNVTLHIEVPVEDMARPMGPPETPSATRATIWAAIYPRLVELIRQHATTLIFVNSRRTAEKLSAALNELAGEVLVQAHHGSIARLQRVEIEDNLKAGRVRGLVATSSLELGIDMGSIDLVVQIEAPPSVASGLQRIGRAGHQVGGTSAGVLFPKYRADLVACATLVRAMHDGEVESTRYPRNPLDVLAQQIVAMVAIEDWQVDTLFARVRQAAPYVHLSRRLFEGVLDLLSGRYLSDAFADLRPRLTWDRLDGKLTARDGAHHIAITNGGTIPDRGLYGVFLAGAEKKQARVGELDEEMVFETHPGEVFVLGASSWRVEEITHDKVLVSPAPGQPGKVPFWHGDQPVRPLELGRKIGALTRTLRGQPRAASLRQLERLHGLEPKAAEHLLTYLDDQQQATAAIPDDQTLVIERTRDELGDWRICLMTPFGGQVLAPWSLAVAAKIREERGQDVETLWTNDGIVVRIPSDGGATPPDVAFLLPTPQEVEALVMGELGASALFAARFREASARALLLPRRRPGTRTPLWMQRKRASDLLSVAAEHPSFPMVLEAYRECLRDQFDMPALREVLDQAQKKTLQVRIVDPPKPSPFAAALLFGYVANFLYDGDAPLAERRAQALSIDQGQLRELLGEAELRELLDPESVADVEAVLQCTDPRRHARSPDSLHDLFLRLGDLSRAEVGARAGAEWPAWLDALVQARRVIAVTVAGDARYIAAEDAARYRDALGTPLPAGLPSALLAPAVEPLADLAARYARTHGPFTAAELGKRLGLAASKVLMALQKNITSSKILEGAFRPGGTTRELCEADVLRQLRAKALAKLRAAVEPVSPAALGRHLTHWHHVVKRRHGLDALLDVVEKLQGLPLPASLLDSEILPARLEAYLSSDLDSLVAAGEVVWAGIEPLGERDGRVALFLTDQLGTLWRPRPEVGLGVKETAVLAYLRAHGATFFPALLQGLGGGFPGEVVEALWSLVWKGLVTNDTVRALRAQVKPPEKDRRGQAMRPRAFRSRRDAPPEAEGRWSALPTKAPDATAWGMAMAQQLLARYGVVTREVAQAEDVEGGFTAVYTVLRGLEEAGRVRRGYFVSGVGALQFALPGVLELLRSHRDAAEVPELVTLSAIDPANPYGSLLPWPELPGTSRAPSRQAGAQVVLVDGALAGYVGRGGRQVFAYLPADEPERGRVMRVLAGALATRMPLGHGWLVEDINQKPAREHALAPLLIESGFSPVPTGLQLRRHR